MYPELNALSRFGVSNRPLKGLSRSSLFDALHGLMCDAIRSSVEPHPVTEHFPFQCRIRCLRNSP